MKVKVKMKKKRKDSKKVAKIALFTKDESVLLLKRSVTLKKHKGEWDLPGGHVHIGEEIEDGLKREVKEETGLILDDVFYVCKVENDYFFAGRWSGESIHLSDEHDSFVFGDVGKINDLNHLTNYYKEIVLKCYEVITNNE